MHCTGQSWAWTIVWTSIALSLVSYSLSACTCIHTGDTGTRKHDLVLNSLQPIRSRQKKQKPCTKVQHLVLNSYINSHKLMESSQRSWHHMVSLGSKELSGTTCIWLATCANNLHKVSLHELCIALVVATRKWSQLKLAEMFLWCSRILWNVKWHKLLTSDAYQHRIISYHKWS